MSDSTADPTPETYRPQGLGAQHLMDGGAGPGLGLHRPGPNGTLRDTLGGAHEAPPHLGDPIPPLEERKAVTRREVGVSVVGTCTPCLCAFEPGTEVGAEGGRAAKEVEREPTHPRAPRAPGPVGPPRVFSKRQEPPSPTEKMCSHQWQSCHKLQTQRKPRLKRIPSHTQGLVDSQEVTSRIAGQGTRSHWTAEKLECLQRTVQFGLFSFLLGFPFTFFISQRAFSESTGADMPLCCSWVGISLKDTEFTFINPQPVLSAKDSKGPRPKLSRISSPLAVW